MYAMDNKSISSLKVLHLVLPNPFICSSSMDNKSISSLKVLHLCGLDTTPLKRKCVDMSYYNSCDIHKK